MFDTYDIYPDIGDTSTVQEVLSTGRFIEPYSTGTGQVHVPYLYSGTGYWVRPTVLGTEYWVRPTGTVRTVQVQSPYS